MTKDVGPTKIINLKVGEGFEKRLNNVRSYGDAVHDKYVVMRHT